MYIKQEKKLNGEIEFLRFVFSMIIVVFHFNKSFPLNLFSMGKIGVEFFFIVTGVLLARSIKNILIETNEIPGYTYYVVKKKIANFYPYYIMTLLSQFIIIRVLMEKHTVKEIIENFAKSIPRVFLFDGLGFRMENFIDLGTDWYLSSMVLSVMFLTPLLLYNYEWTSKILFPIGGLLGLGAIFMNYGYIFILETQLSPWIDGQTIRGVCEIALGVWAYELAQIVKEWKLTKVSKITLSIFKWLCFGVIIIYSFKDFGNKYSIIAFLSCLIGVVLSFSEKTYTIPYNQFTKLLGKLSLPIYLTHVVIRRFCDLIFNEKTGLWKIYIVICLCPIIAYLFMTITDFLIIQVKKIKYIFIEVGNN